MKYVGRVSIWTQKTCVRENTLFNRGIPAKEKKKYIVICDRHRTAVAAAVMVTRDWWERRWRPDRRAPKTNAGPVRRRSQTFRAVRQQQTSRASFHLTEASDSVIAGVRVMCVCDVFTRKSTWPYIVRYSRRDFLPRFVYRCGARLQCLNYK